MSRPYRLSAPGFHHHVTQRGNFRQDVFRTPADHLIFLDQLQQAAALEGCLIHAYCLMSNHFHLLLHPLLPTSLSRTLQRASSGYARLLNLRLHRRGHVWQARFYSSPIEPTHVPRVIRIATGCFANRISSFALRTQSHRLIRNLSAGAPRLRRIA